jgi:hypothetical protein
MGKTISLCLALGILVASSAAHAQAFPLKGTMVSASITSTSSVASTIYTTPTTGHFVLMGIGALNDPAGGLTQFSATGWGSLGSICPGCNTQGAKPYQISFDPGVALPAGTSIQCVTAGAAPDCYIMGVLEK